MDLQEGRGEGEMVGGEEARSGEGSREEMKIERGREKEGKEKQYVLLWVGEPSISVSPLVPTDTGKQLLTVVCTSSSANRGFAT